MIDPRFDDLELCLKHIQAHAVEPSKYRQSHRTSIMIDVNTALFLLHSLKEVYQAAIGEAFPEINQEQVTREFMNTPGQAYREQET